MFCTVIIIRTLVKEPGTFPLNLGRPNLFMIREKEKVVIFADYVMILFDFIMKTDLPIYVVLVYRSHCLWRRWFVGFSFSFCRLYWTQKWTAWNFESTAIHNPINSLKHTIPHNRPHWRPLVCLVSCWVEVSEYDKFLQRWLHSKIELEWRTEKKLCTICD